MSLSRAIARPLLAAAFVTGAAGALKNSSALAEKAEPVTEKLVPLVRRAVPQFPSDPTLLVRVNAGVQLAAALGLATGKAPRCSAAVLAATMVPTTWAGYPFWKADSPAAKKEAQMGFTKNVSLVGGLIIAAGDTDGAPGVAWRTKKAASDASKGAKSAAKSAKREVKSAKRAAKAEAKLAAKSLPGA
ncbi:DoxX family membrane protein [Nocardioides bruguierae]|uniref:DoxX family membrane protein n=1 Tax=Nocardioides bruguierae TaxID=2945102 RepID=UPI002022643F|nr:DoxX family membrane protein [Nocardioides bruguierae]MCL8024831.1 DoxX family membrane protein [Nocardioides bruguierae]